MLSLHARECAVKIIIMRRMMMMGNWYNVRG